MHPRILHPTSSALAGILLAGAAAAAPTAQPQAATTDAAKASSDAKPEALKHFKLGLELFEMQAYDGALVEFLKSRELLPTRNAIKNAATCYRELKRYEEALDMYEELQAKFGAELPPADQAFVATEMARLLKLVGTVAVESVPAGATVTVDGKIRGTTPLSGPLRLTVGTHAIRIAKDGYAPFETTVALTSGAKESVSANLSIVAKVGTLSVREKSGRAAKLVVDGVIVGATPWEGTLSAGTHVVALDGGAEAEAEAQSLTLVAGNRVELAPELLPRRAELRVEGASPTATILLDGQEVGHGTFAGKLAAGPHRLEVRDAEYEPYDQALQLVAGKSLTVRVPSERQRRYTFDLAVGYSPANALGAQTPPADADVQFTSSLLLRLGRMMGPRVTLEGGASVLGGVSKRTRTASIQRTDGRYLRDDTVEDDSSLLAGLVTAGASYRFFDRFPLTLRGFGGIGYASLSLSATTSSSSGDFNSESLRAQETTSSGWMPVCGLEARWGLRLSKGFVLDVGITATGLWTQGLTLGSWTTYDDVDAEPSLASPPTKPRLPRGLTFATPITLGFHWDL